ncbi:GNAT family N-acetyltransferase [Aestuariicella hydrocarbonica]|uniref:GNAT family N-acetyltransferase n=1 Tax=Pseudomaricurvus hydrocarbonicus TaxID=1470433 RepID=A0A9E5JSM3_9GAMM|nr:GNAT family N-acetyltransferase [Aestuariicella hydrocarbonica]NHO64681.1 GNAT family N-acetyltransferase [Aestuariicella hydrocarbonica]
MNTNNSIALVIGLCSHGIAMCRALKQEGVDVHAFEAKNYLPGAATNTANIHYVKNINENSLIDDLLQFRQAIDRSTAIVLFPTNDNNVRILAENVDRITPDFLLSWSENAEDILNLLLKSNIERRCLEMSIRYPKSKVLKKTDDTLEAINQFEFPVLIKPVKPQSGFKALRCDTPEALQENIDKYQKDLPILLQDWISGTDKDLFFGALYLDHGKVISSFCGNKLESHPPAMGQTTVAISAHNPEVIAITKQFFEGLKLSGPVSLELKQDEKGRLWVIEPTIGRTDFWVGLCTAANVNLLYTEYVYTLGLDPQPSKPIRPAIWFDSEKDSLALFRHLDKLLALEGTRYTASFSYLTREDLKPSMVATKALLARVPSYLHKKTFSDKPATKDPDDIQFIQYTGYQQLPDDCKKFLVDQSKIAVFSYDSWYENFCRTVASSKGSVCFLCLYKKNQVAAILPMWYKKESMGGKRVNLISGLTNYYTPIFSMSWDETLITESLAGQCFLKHVMENGTWDLINLSPMPEETVVNWQKIATQLNKASFHYYVTKNMFEDEIKDFSSYMKARPSRLKNTIKRKTKKLTSLGDWHIDIITNLEDLPQALTSYHQVYNQSWKKSEPYPDFIDGLAQLGAEQNWLRLGILYIENRAVAVQFWLVERNTAYIYKLAYAREYKDYSPGTILTHRLMEHVITRDGVTKVDFLTGGEAFKLDWMTSFRNLHGIQIVNKQRPMGFLFYLRNLAGHFRKSLWTPPLMQSKSMYNLRLSDPGKRE